jgi:hypothetical protein
MAAHGDDGEVGGDMDTIAVRLDRPSATGSELFGRHGYLVIPQLIEPPLADFLQSYVHTKFASRLLNVGDRQVPNTPTDYGDPAFDGLLEYLRPRVEERSGLALYPTYSYFRLYKRGDILKRHRDRPACEISVTLNLGQTPANPWPINIERDAGPNSVALAPGDALLYRGCDCFHWREPYQGTRLAQVFLHYVDRNGPHADQKYDRRKTLMRPTVHRAGDTNHNDV